MKAAVCAIVILSSIASALCRDNQTVPFGVGVAFSGKDAGTAASVTWTTLGPTDPVYVRFGTQSGGPYTTVSGYSSQYYESYQHHAVLSGLTPLTRYYYVCGSALAESVEFSFVTARAAGDPTPFSIAIVGDMGVTQSQATMEQLNKLTNVDWFMHVGDISYADDENSVNFGSYENTWNKFQIEMENVTANYPYMVCPGNHEANCLVTGFVGCPKGLTNFSAYRNRFLMPSLDSGGVENMWYSFDYGLVHFVMMDSETDYKLSPEGPLSQASAGPFGDQMGWLKNDLKKATSNRQTTPWIVAVAHRPMYSSEESDFPPDALKNWRNAVEQTLYENNVDLYISGHVHSYERIFPIYNNVVGQYDYDNPRDITPLVIGNAGCMEGHNTFTKTQPDYVAYRNNVDWGYGILYVDDESTIRFEMRRSDDNTVADSFTLTRSH